MPGTEKMTVMPWAASQLPNQPVLAVDEDERQADDDRGDGEGDVDQRIEQPGAGEAVAGQDERDADPEDRVQRHGDGGHEQREPRARAGRPAAVMASHAAPSPC